jgi:hypothetical protein
MKTPRDTDTIDTPTDALTTLAGSSLAPSSITPDMAGALANKLLGEGFAEEKTFWIGNPVDGKVPIYFGELIGPGGSVMVEPPGAKADPVTGEVPMTEIPVYVFNPLDPTTFAPFKARVDTVLCSHAVAQACAKYDTLAKAAGGTAQILFRWNGVTKTRKGNQLNDVSVIGRVLKRQS